MATISLKRDDLTGDDLPNDHESTLLFIEDPRGDVSIKIDLSDTNFKKLVKALQPFVDKGEPYTPVTRMKAASTTSTPSEASQARAWAMAHRPDLNVKDRGKVPEEALKAYRDHLSALAGDIDHPDNNTE
jgi:hypothetical protein